MSALTSEPPGVIDDVPGYQDLTQLGRDGFATTYRARREDGDDLVAVKVLGSDLADAPARKALARYRQDAQRLAEQVHVLHALDSGSTYTGQLYVMTRYCERGSLGDRMRASGPLPVEEALGAAVPVALALHAAHRLGLCHRSVKPSTILLDSDGQPKLADFVTARLRADRLLSLAGPTPQHTAPEVLSGAEPSPQSDVYSLAATLFHLLAGRAPYPDRGGVAGLLLSMMSEGAPRISRTDAPESLREALARALATEPDARFPDALAFAAQLHRALVELDVSVPYPATIWPEQVDPRPPTADEPAASSSGGVRPAHYLPSPARPERAAPTPQAERAARSPQPERAAPTSQPEGSTPQPERIAEPPGSQPGPTAESAPDVDTVTPADTTPAESPDPEPTVDADAAPRRRLRTVVAGAGLLVLVALAGGAWLAAATGRDDAAGSRPASVTEPAARPGSAQPTTSAPLTSLAPADVTAIDSGAAVSLHWSLPTAAADANVVVQQQPAPPGQSQLTILNPGRTSHPVTGLDPATGYCFRVGVLVSIGSAGRPASVAWSSPVGVRGACAVASSSPTPRP